MNILVVDDERTLTKLDADHDVTYARNVIVAILCLCNGPFDEIWLDHDLGGNETIRPFVDMLEEVAVTTGVLHCNRIVAHSMNPVGRRYIRLALGDLYPVREEIVGDWL